MSIIKEFIDRVSIYYSGAGAGGGVVEGAHCYYGMFDVFLAGLLIILYRYSYYFPWYRQVL